MNRRNSVDEYWRKKYEAEKAEIVRMEEELRALEAESAQLDEELRTLETRAQEEQRTLEKEKSEIVDSLYNDLGVFIAQCRE